MASSSCFFKIIVYLFWFLKAAAVGASESSCIFFDIQGSEQVLVILKKILDLTFFDGTVSRFFYGVLCFS